MSKEKPISAAPAIPEPTVQVPASTLADLIAAAVDRRVAEIMTAKGPDERIADAMAAQRGQNMPAPHEALVDCVSPITGATFTARMLMPRRPGAPWRVVELLDYTRPEGWDRLQQDGGLVPNGVELKNEVTGKPSQKFMLSVHRDYYVKDNQQLLGKPLPDLWRVDRPSNAAPPAGSVVLTPEQLQALGITADQVQAALSVSATAAE